MRGAFWTTQKYNKLLASVKPCWLLRSIMDFESAHLIGEDRTPTTTGPLIGSISASESPNEEAEMTLMGGLVGLLCCFRNVRNRITVISDPQYARCTPMLPGTPETIVTLFLELSHAHQRDAFHYRSIQATRPEQVLRALRAYTRTITQETIGTSLRHYFRQQLFFWPPFTASCPPVVLAFALASNSVHRQSCSSYLCSIDSSISWLICCYNSLRSVWEQMESSTRW